jgi:hypothetical protein
MLCGLSNFRIEEKGTKIWPLTVARAGSDVGKKLLK